jgi:hypothetical protein
MLNLTCRHPILMKAVMINDADADDENTNSGSYRLDGLDPEDAKARGHSGKQCYP